MRHFILTARRGAVIFVVLLGLIYLRASNSEALAAIGLVSFCGVAQFLPSLVGGLYWSRATAAGALVGLFAGLFVWGYTLVLPSFDDEAAAFGDADPGATAARYAAAGAEVVVVKTGGGPVVTLDRGGRGKVGCEAVAPVDTTGAGDSFNAGFLAALIGGAGLEAAVRAGHAVAAQVVRQPGALVLAISSCPDHEGGEGVDLQATSGRRMSILRAAPVASAGPSPCSTSSSAPFRRPAWKMSGYSPTIRIDPNSA